MARKTYDMYCAVARALEVLGERWTLLVVRELLTGPKRFADLQAGLPGIATNMLSDRLRSLTDAGAVAQRTLPPPAASMVYELTERGRELKPVLLALGTWGMPLLGAPREGEQFRLAWLMIALDGVYDPAAAPTPVTVSLIVEGNQVTIAAHGPRHDVTVGPSRDQAADITVEANREAFLGWATGQLTDAQARHTGLTVHPADGLTRLRSLYPAPART